MSFWGVGIDLVERGLVPDAVTRIAIRRLCGERLRATQSWTPEQHQSAVQSFVQQMRTGEIAPVPHRANEQHYELPAPFFTTVLGPRRKYSCCYFEEGADLAAAEEAALAITCERAGLADGQDVLELGCGWGSLSLWMAERYPHSRITAVSNSRPQREWIESQAVAKGLRNLTIQTADINHFAPTTGPFDRVVSVEMFEHLRNYQLLLQRIASWMKHDAQLFVHHFCHRQLAYPYETDGAANWMGQYFFTGGLMPSETMLDHFHDDLRVVQRWNWNGQHYQKTSEAWLRLLDARKADVLPILATAFGARDAERWFHRWRMFFLAVAEMFGMHHGKEWYVTHALLKKANSDSSARAT
jgi:cyclopropane-fatty-acyl-phospholipid synthase